MKKRAARVEVVTPETVALTDASQRWVSTLGIEDSVVREAIVWLRARNADELKACVHNGELARQPGMGPKRMALVRRIAGCVSPTPPQAIKDGVMGLIMAVANICDGKSEKLRHDMITLAQCVRDNNNAVDCKLYAKYARGHVQPAVRKILEA